MEILVAGMALLLALAIIGLVVRPCWRRRSTTSSLMMGRWSDFARGSEYTEPRSLELQPRTAPLGTARANQRLTRSQPSLRNR